MQEDHVVYVCSECFTEYQEDHEGGCLKDGARLRRITLHSEDTMVGKVLDERYVVDEKIGHGGMGSVYRARQLSMDRVVAIKTMHDKGESAGFIPRFLREANVASKLNHPHVVSIIDFGQTPDGVLYIVMELLEGESLGERLEAGRAFTLEHTLAMTDQLLSALSSAHDAHVVHRDLKPDNIFLLDVPGGDVFSKVLDFGIAKAMESGDAMTQTGQVFGTPAYMSPEQCRGDTALDARSDLYSLGCILYELLSGATPFQDDSIIKMMFRHVGEPVPELVPRSPRVEDDGTYDELMTFLMRLLAKAPAERFSDAMEARASLAEARAAIGAQVLALPAWRQINEGEREAETVKLSFSPTLLPDETPASELEAVRDPEVQAPSLPDPPIPLAEPATAAPLKTRAMLVAVGAVVAVVVAIVLVGVASFTAERGQEPVPPKEPAEVAATTPSVADAPEVGAPDAGGSSPGTRATPSRVAPPDVAVAIFASGGHVHDALEDAVASMKRASRSRRTTKTRPPKANSLAIRTTKSVTKKITAFTNRQARACIIKNVQRRPNTFWPEGKDRATLRLVYGLDPKGEVVEATITRQGSDFFDADVNRCIQNKFKALAFHKSATALRNERFEASLGFTYKVSD